MELLVMERLRGSGMLVELNVRGLAATSLLHLIYILVLGYPTLLKAMDYIVIKMQCIFMEYQKMFGISTPRMHLHIVHLVLCIFMIGIKEQQVMLLVKREVFLFILSGKWDIEHRYTVVEMFIHTQTRTGLNKVISKKNKSI